MQASSSSSTLLIRGGCLQPAPRRSGSVLCSRVHEAPAAHASVEKSSLPSGCRLDNSLRTVDTRSACSCPQIGGHAAGQEARCLYSNRGASMLAGCCQATQRSLTLVCSSTWAALLLPARTLDPAPLTLPPAHCSTATAV